MTVPFLVLGLGAFWVLLCWRVRVEQGFVGTPPMRLQIAMRELVRGLLGIQMALGEALLPVVRETAERLAEFADTWRRVQPERDEADLDAFALLEPPCGDPRPDPRTHPEFWTE